MVLPDSSSAVTTKVLKPFGLVADWAHARVLTSSQSKVTEVPEEVLLSQTFSYSTVIVIDPSAVQLSSTSPIIPGTVTTLSPLGFNFIVSPVAIKSRLGALLSSTVIVAVADAEFPAASSTVRVTVLSPKFEQSKSETSKL